MTTREQWQRWRGLKDLVKDVVEHGSSAVQRVHMETARRPFRILEQIPPLAPPTRVVRAIHDASVSTVYGMIRLVNAVVGEALGVVLDVAERRASGERTLPDRTPEQTHGSHPPDP
jgi:hypothetical protein